MGRRVAARVRRAVRSAVAVPLLVVACGAGPQPRAAPPEGVGVASFNFPESRLVAEIYAQALEDEGIDVRRELDLGPRELVMPALRQGLVDVVPEYLGTALTAADPGSPADASDPDAVRRALASAVDPWGLRVLAHAAAQNQNALVVTRRTAERLSLVATSDLAPVAGTLTLGGPPECPERRYCLGGLTDVYGLRFEAFVPIAGEDRVRRALDDGVVDVGVLFTTDGALVGGDLVLLADDRGLQPAENLTPMVRADIVEGPGGDRVVTALDDVSSRLTTANLRFLNWRVSVAGNAPAAEAHGWLVRQGLVGR